MPVAVPERIAWTVEQLHPRPTDTILEIGCGNGTAAALLLAKLTAGKLVALDRSTTAVAAARRRLEPWIRSGRVVLARGSLASYGFGDETFDQAFAINVNSFWRLPAAELAALRGLLRPGGRLTLVYDPPSVAQLSKLGEATKNHLREAGFEGVRARIQRLERSSVVCIRALTPAGKPRR